MKNRSVEEWIGLMQEMVTNNDKKEKHKVSVIIGEDEYVDEDGYERKLQSIEVVIKRNNMVWYKEKLYCRIIDAIRFVYADLAAIITESLKDGIERGLEKYNDSK